MSVIDARLRELKQKQIEEMKEKEVVAVKSSVSYSQAAIMQFDCELDVKGLNCPLPILRTKKALAEMESGQVLRVLATDPGSPGDFAAFSRQTGNELLDQREENRVFGSISSNAIDTAGFAFLEDRRRSLSMPAAWLFSGPDTALTCRSRGRFCRPWPASTAIRCPGWRPSTTNWAFIS